MGHPLRHRVRVAPMLAMADAEHPHRGVAVALTTIGMGRARAPHAAARWASGAGVFRQPPRGPIERARHRPTSRCRRRATRGPAVLVRARPARRGGDRMASEPKVRDRWGLGRVLRGRVLPGLLLPGRVLLEQVVPARRRRAPVRASRAAAAAAADGLEAPSCRDPLELRLTFCYTSPVVEMGGEPIFFSSCIGQVIAQGRTGNRGSAWPKVLSIRSSRPQ